MRPVLVLIFHAEAAPDAGPLVRALAEARHSLARRQLDRWLAAGADDAEIVSGPPDGLTFGERLGAGLRARASDELPEGSVIVLGSGSIPLARDADLQRFVEAAGGPGGHALANNRYSADVVALSRASDLSGLPPLPADNALPRWLEERAGVMVSDLRGRWRLSVDVDTPLELLVLSNAGALARSAISHSLEAIGAAAPLVGERLATLADVLRNRRAELLVAGRVSATTLRFLDSGVACRVRALVEERGLRASSHLAQDDAPTPHGRAAITARPPRSILGALLDRDGPASLAQHVADLADAAVIDTRVLMAHRFGAGEAAWPGPEDRFASDLLAPSAVSDPWLRALASSAADSPADRPILLGGHTLVNGGLRLLAQQASHAKRARPVAR
jgi:hypothetical protein